MTTLLDTIQTTTQQVLDGQITLDAALTYLSAWVEERAPHFTTEERAAFSEALDRQTTDDNASLVDSVLKLHATRLLYRYDVAHHDAGTADTSATPYEQARTRFTRALRRSEEAVNDARIDIAIANAHNLLGDSAGSRRWLESALAALPDLANVDLPAIAGDVPAMPIPRLTAWKRIGLKLIGFPFERLAASNRESLLAIAHLQMNQVALLAHLLGTSFEAVRDRQRTRRAFRIVAHLVMRYRGLPDLAPDQALEIAEDLLRYEGDAARTLARQGRAACDEGSASEPDSASLRERAEALLGLPISPDQE